jgi:hypothetical protein
MILGDYTCFLFLKSPMPKEGIRVESSRLLLVHVLAAGHKYYLCFLLVIFVSSVTTVNNVIGEIFESYHTRGNEKRAVQGLR